MGGPHAAFFYGTLMAPEVFFTVVYGSSRPAEAIRNLHTFQPAILSDFCRHRVKNVDYPGIVPEAGRSVRGVFATGLTEANVGKLDNFEGGEYRRELVRVRLLSGAGEDARPAEGTEAEAEAEVYVFKSRDGLELGEWDFEHFRKEKLRFWAREEIVFNEYIDEPATSDGPPAGEDAKHQPKLAEGEILNSAA